MLSNLFTYSPLDRHAFSSTLTISKTGRVILDECASDFSHFILSSTRDKLVLCFPAKLGIAKWTAQMQVLSKNTETTNPEEAKSTKNQK